MPAFSPYFTLLPCHTAAASLLLTRIHCFAIFACSLTATPACLLPLPALPLFRHLRSPARVPRVHASFFALFLAARSCLACRLVVVAAAPSSSIRRKTSRLCAVRHLLACRLQRRYGATATKLFFVAAATALIARFRCVGHLLKHRAFLPAAILTHARAARRARCACCQAPIQIGRRDLDIALAACLRASCTRRRCAPRTPSGAHITARLVSLHHAATCCGCRRRFAFFG